MIYYQDSHTTLYQGNCLDVLPQLEADSVQCCMTSPPYNIGLHDALWDDRKSKEDHELFTGQWLQALWRVCSESSRQYIFCSDKMHYWMKPIVEEVGFTFAQTLWWGKPNIGMCGKRISGDWNCTAEPILLFRKGKRTNMLSALTETTHNYFVIAACQSNFKEQKTHPAQFPERLIRRLLLRTPGDIVLDPFCGSGTTLAVAKELGRQAIGIEIAEEYCEVAMNRCRRQQVARQQVMSWQGTVQQQVMPLEGDTNNGKLRS